MKDLNAKIVTDESGTNFKLYYKSGTLYYAEELNSDYDVESYTYFYNGKYIATISMWDVATYTRGYSVAKMQKLFSNLESE